MRDSSGQSRPFEILLVEDNPADVRLIREALAGGSTAKRIHVAEDGEEALRFLAKAGPWKDAPEPDLILLDLNLPKKGGRELLAEIRDGGGRRLVPVVVFSSSTAIEDVTASYEARANCYVAKPAGLDRFFQVIQRIESFWLETARLPRNGG